MSYQDFCINKLIQEIIPGMVEDFKTKSLTVNEAEIEQWISNKHYTGSASFAEIKIFKEPYYSKTARMILFTFKYHRNEVPIGFPKFAIITVLDHNNKSEAGYYILERRSNDSWQILICDDKLDCDYSSIADCGTVEEFANAVKDLIYKRNRTLRLNVKNSGEMYLEYRDNNTSKDWRPLYINGNQWHFKYAMLVPFSYLIHDEYLLYTEDGRFTLEYNGEWQSFKIEPYTCSCSTGNLWDDTDIGDDIDDIIEASHTELFLRLKRNSIYAFGFGDYPPQVVKMMAKLNQPEKSYIESFSRYRQRGDLSRAVCCYLLWMLTQYVPKCLDNVVYFEKFKADTNADDEFEYFAEKLCSNIESILPESLNEIQPLPFNKIRALTLNLLKLLYRLSTIINGKEAEISDLMNQNEFERFPKVLECHWVLKRHLSLYSGNIPNINRILVPDFLAESVAYEKGCFSDITPDRYYEPDRFMSEYHKTILKHFNDALRSWDIVYIAYWWSLLAWDKLQGYSSDGEVEDDIRIGESENGTKVFERLKYFDKNLKRRDENLIPILSLAYYREDECICYEDLLTVAVRQLEYLY